DTEVEGLVRIGELLGVLVAPLIRGERTLSRLGHVGDNDVSQAALLQHRLVGLPAAEHQYPHVEVQDAVAQEPFHHLTVEVLHRADRPSSPTALASYR